MEKSGFKRYYEKYREILVREKYKKAKPSLDSNPHSQRHSGAYQPLRHTAAGNGLPT